MQTTTLNHIEALEIAIYNTKHIQSTKLRFQKSNMTRKETFPELRHSVESAFIAMFYGPLSAGLIF